MKYFKSTLAHLLLALIALTSIASAQASSNQFVYLKNSAGILVGVIVHDGGLAAQIKSRSYCLLQKFTSGITCEAVDPSSPFASDPNKALKFVNRDPSVTPDVFNKIQSDISNLSAQLGSFNKPATTPAPVYNQVSDAAVPDQLEGTDRQNVSVSTGQQPAASTQQPTPPNVAPQFNSPVALPDISALVNAAVSRALANATPLQAQQQLAPVTPSQVISSFFSGTTMGSQYVGYGAGELNANANGELKGLSLGSDGLNTPIAVIASSTVGQLNATAAVVGNSTVTNIYAGNLVGSGATFTNLYVNGVFNTASGTFSVVATNSNFAVLSASTTNASTSNADNLIATNATTGNATSTNLFSSFGRFLSALIGSLVADSIQVRTITATSSSYALNAYASTSEASTTNAITVNGVTGNFQNLYASSTFASTSNAQNLAVSGSSTLASTTVSNITSTGNVAGQAFVGGTGSFSNLSASGSSTLGSTTLGNTTLQGNAAVTGTLTAGNLNSTGSSTLGSTTVSNLTSTGNLSGANLAVSGSSTIGSTTASNLTVTGSLATNIFNAITAVFSSLTSTIANIATLNAGTGNFANLNATGTSQLTTVLASTTNASTSNISNLSATNATLSNATVTSSFATTQYVTNASVTNLTVGGNNITNVISQINTTLNTQTVNASTTNASTTNTTNFNTSNATITNASTTNIYAAGNVTVGGNATITSAGAISAANFTTAGSSTLGSTTASNLTVTGSLASTIFNSISGFFTNLTGTNATLTNASSTNLFASALTALSALFPSLTAGAATVGTLNATSSVAALSLFASTTNASTSNATLGAFVNLTASGSSTLGSSTISNLTVPGSFAAGNLTSNTLTLTVAPNGWLYTNATGQVFASSSPTVSYITATTSTSTFAGIALNGSIVPLADAAYDLGSPSKRFKSLYVSSSTIYIDGVALSNTAGQLTWAGSGIVATAGQSQLASTTISNATITSTLYMPSLNNLGGLLFATSSGLIAQTNAVAYNQAQNKIILTGGITAGATITTSGIDMNSTRITNLAVPVSTTDAVNKAYVDSAFASGVLWQAPVKSLGTSTAPVSPATGDRYVILAGQSGYGSCVNNDIAEWSGAAWVCTTPATGTTVFVDSFINQQYNFNGSAWNSIATAIDHNNLFNLQGGQANEYYHLKASDYTALTAGTAQLTNLQTTGNPTFNSITITNGINSATSSFTNATATTLSATNFTTANSTSTTLFAQLASITTLTTNTLNATLANGYVLRGSSANKTEATSSIFIADNGSVGIGTTTGLGGGLHVGGGLVSLDGSRFFGATNFDGNVAVSNGHSFDVNGDVTTYGTNLLYGTTTVNGSVALNGSTTLSSTTAANLTVTGNFAAAVFNAVSAVLSSIFATTGNFTTLNATTSNASTSNVVNLLTTGSSTLGSTTASNVSVTGNLAAAILNAVSAVIGTLTASVGNIATLNTGTFNVTTINATGTSQFSNVLASTTSASSSSIGNATITNATITGSIAFGSGSSIAAKGGTSTFATSTIASATLTYALNVPGTATLATATIASSTITKLNSQGAVLGVATVTSATATNLFATNASMSAATATNFFANNASISSVTANSLAASIFSALSASFSSLFSPTIYVTNLYATTTSASTSYVQQAVGVGTSTNIYGGSLTAGATVNGGIVLSSTTSPATTTQALYNNNGTLYFNGSALGGFSGFASSGQFTNFYASTSYATTSLASSSIATNATITNATATSLAIANLANNNASGLTLVTAGTNGNLGTTSVTSVSAEGLLVYSAGSQSVPSGTVTALTDLTSVTQNDFGASSLSGGAFTVPAGKAGWYTISGNYILGNFVAGTVSQISIAVNGTIVATNTIEPAGGNSAYPLATISKYLSPGDIVSLRAFHSSGSPITTSGGVGGTFLSLVRLNFNVYGNSGSSITPSFNASGANLSWSATTAQADINAVSFDTNNNFSSSTNRYTPTIAGKYLFTARYTFCGTVVDTGGYSVIIRKNGVSVGESTISQSGTGICASPSASIVTDANGSTDFFDVAYQANSGSGASSVSFSGSRIDGGSGPWTQASSTFAYSAVSSLAIGTSTYQNANSLYITNGLSLASSTPTGTTANTLYALGSSLYWNGSAVGSGTTSSTGTSTLGLLVYSASSQSVPSGAITTVTDLTSTTRNDFGSSALSGGAFTVPTGKDGWYTISGNMGFTGGNPTSVVIYIKKNGTTIALSQDTSSGGNSPLSASTQTYLNAGDVITLAVYQNSGSAQTLFSTITSLSLVRINADSIWTSSGQNTYFNGGMVAIGTSTILNTNLTVQATSSASAIANFMTYTGTTSLYITTGGDVLLGTTTSPGTGAPLYVYGSINGTNTMGIKNTSNGSAANAAFTAYNDNNYSVQIGIYSSGVGSSGGPNSAFISNSAATPITINSGGTERLRIDGSGNVLIGATTRAGFWKQEISFNGATHYGVNLNETAAGTGSRYINFMSSGVTIGNISNSAGATSYNTTSDRRKKENIATTSKGLSDLLDIQVADFSFIGDASRATQTGFIAQNLNGVFSDAVTTNGDDGEVALGATATPWSVDYGRVTPLIVRAVQEIATISGVFKNNLIAWLGDAQNGLTEIVAGTVRGHLLCADDVCLNSSQLKTILGNNGLSTEPATSTGSTSTPGTDWGTWGSEGTVLGTSTSATSTAATSSAATASTTEAVSGTSVPSDNAPAVTKPTATTPFVVAETPPADAATPANDNQPAPNGNTSPTADSASTEQPATGTDGQ